MRNKRYNRNLGGKVKVLHLSLVNHQRKVLITLGFLILFLILSYAYLIFSSVAYAYSLNDDKEQLSKIIAQNSSLKSQFLNKKDDIIEKNKSYRVAVGKIDYIRISDTKLAYNK